MTDKRKLIVFTGVVIGVMIGSILLFSKIVITKETGGFSFGTAMAVTGSMVLGAFFSYLLSIRKKKRTKNIPEVDERTILILKNYFVWAFYFVMIGSGLVTLILYLMDIRTIEIGMIAVYQLIIFIIVAIGAFVTKMSR